MKLLHTCLLWVIITACLPAASEAQTVYITRTGAKYHITTCHYLRSSKISIKLSEAKRQGYTACSVCKPSTKVTDTKDQATEADTTVLQPTPSKNPKPITASRCTATTQAGTQCKRTTTSTSGKCWQHE